jgi:6-phosphogluconolactonase
MTTAYIGTYTRASRTGIYAYRHDEATGALTLLGVAAETWNPSFVGVHPGGRFLYAVNEGPEGAVSAFAIAAPERLTPLNTVASHGADPCHMAFDSAGRWLFVANYSGGSVALFPIRADGSLGEAARVVQHQGSSLADPSRQEGPHVHSVELSPDDRYLYVDDLGQDAIVVYRFDNGALTPHAKTKTAPGAGPRHLAFSPDRRFAYGFNELDATVNSYRHDAATAALENFQTISALPSGYTGRKWGAEITVHPTGKFLFASNRAHDSIATFGITGDGSLVAAGHVPTQGIQPRHFILDRAGAFLHVANADSNNLVTFRINVATGELTPTGQVIEVPEPVCVILA